MSEGEPNKFNSVFESPPMTPTTEDSPHPLIINKALMNIKRESNGMASLARSDGALNQMNGHLSPPLSPTERGITPTFQRQRSTASNFSSQTGVMYRKDILYSGSINNINNISSFRSNRSLNITSVQSIPNTIPLEKDWKIFQCLKLSPEMRDAMRQMLDFSLLKDVIFLLFVISNFCTSIGFNMPYIYLPDRAHEAGIDKTRAAFLVSVIGIANTVGRVIFGWLADRPWVNRLMLYSTALTICGVATALSPLSDSYAYLVVYAAIFGSFIGKIFFFFNFWFIFDSTQYRRYLVLPVFRGGKFYKPPSIRRDKAP